MVDDTELAEGGGGVVCDTSIDECANVCEDTVDLRGRERGVRLCAQVVEECAPVSRIVTREDVSLRQIRNETKDGVAEFHVPVVVHSGGKDVAFVVDRVHRLCRLNRYVENVAGPTASRLFN